MTREKTDISALKADKNRQAHNALRGYVYQIWHSVYAWLNLADNEVLFLEGAEDFDIIQEDKSTAVQVKDTQHNITLRSSEIIEAIQHYWELRNAHPERMVLFRLLTRSQVGVEKSNPFGKGVAGLAVWKNCRRNETNIEKLKSFLITEKKLPSDLLEFLSKANDRDILENLIKPITWETGSREASYVENTIKSILVTHGDKYLVSPLDAASVVNRLLKEALTIATKNDNRVLDKSLFLQLFEEETTTRIPNAQLRELQKAAQLVNPFAFGGLSNNITQFQLTSNLQFGVPPLMARLVKRSEILAKLQKSLNHTGLVVITGLTGMGKTTLANLLVQNNHREWLWVSLRNLDATQISLLLMQLVAIIAQDHRSPNMVLDDLDTTPAQAYQYEENLGCLFYTVLENDGHLIITSQRELPSRFSHRMNLSSDSNHRIEGLSEQEITEFTHQYNCPEHLTQYFGRIIYLQTSGHPQLVQARLKNLEKMQWATKEDDILTTPPDITQVRTETRQLLLEQLPEKHCELIYRLSLLYSVFRRDYAVAIGELSPEVGFSGDIFDWLVGPWIEPVGNGYYRISPLLSHAADKVWSKNKIAKLHCAIADVVLCSDDLTLHEAETIFYHGLIGRCEHTLFLVLNIFFTSPEEIWKPLASKFSWFIHANVETQGALFSENMIINNMLRRFQFRIAAEIESQMAVSIANIWDKEIFPPTEPDANYFFSRYLFVSRVIISFEVPLPMDTLLGWLIELIEIHKQLEQNNVFEEMKALFPNNPPPANFFNALDYVPVLFKFIVLKCTNVQLLEQLMDKLCQMPIDIRNRLFTLFQTGEAEEDAKWLTARSWMHEADLENPDWTNCLRVLTKTANLAKQWNSKVLAEAITRGIAVIYEEYLHDPDSAIFALEEIKAQTGQSFTVEDEYATIYLHQKEYEKALEIWDRILPQWQSHPHDKKTPMFACRNAGIAASHTGDWQKAAHFFFEGQHLAQQLNQPRFIIGFFMDAGFALWKTRQHIEAVEIFAEVLYKLEALPDPEKDFDSLIVRRKVAYTLLLIADRLIERQHNLFELHPGMCSNPENIDALKEEPIAPLELSWLNLIKIEYHLKLDTTIFQCVQRQFKNARLPLLHVLLNDFAIKNSFQYLDFSALPVQVENLDIASQATNAQMSKGQQIWERGELDIRVKVSLQNLPDYFFLALVALFSTNQFNPTLFDTWRKNAEGLSMQADINNWIVLAKSILMLDIQTSTQIMKDKKENSKKRLLAILNVSLAKSITPNDLFHAHALLVHEVIQNTSIQNIADYLVAMLTRQWLHKIQSPALLITPKLTVPDIKAACQSEINSLPKVAKIILAVSNAVSVQLPKKYVHQLRQLIQ